jgi:uncharacterized RDD family membrane protein YckC
VSISEIDSPETALATPEYAGFWRRSLAALLDRRRQRLGDKAARTVVLLRAPRVAKERTA